MKKLTVTVDGPKGSGVTRLSNTIRNLNEPGNGPSFDVVDMSEVRDGRSVTLDEFTDEISDAISDSIDMDWSPSDGAKAVVSMLIANGYNVVRRGEDSDVAIAIGQHAFNAGYKSAADRAIAFHPTKVTDYAAHMDAAWSDYTPPDELCGKALT